MAKKKRERRFRNPQSLPHITRMDYEREGPKRGKNVGWFVRVTREYKTKSGFFADDKHGGKAAALKKAKALRDSILATTPPPLRGGARRRKPYERPSRGTITRKTYTYLFRDGYYYEYEAYATWIRVSPTEVKATKWSINKHGEKKAYRMVEKWLQKHRGLQARNYALERQRFFRNAK